MTSRGFVALEGIDGSGKSTQCRLLGDCFRNKGLQVVACADPGGTEVGDALRSILLNHRGQLSLMTEALLFMASRAELVAQVIRPAIDAGAVVISDRFLLSNVVYQGHAGGLNPVQIREYGLFATGDLEPDLTIVLDLPASEAVKRRKARVADRLEARNESFHEAVRQGFLKEARERPNRVRVVKADQGVKEVAAEICKLISTVLPSDFVSAKCALHS